MKYTFIDMLKSAIKITAQNDISLTYNPIFEVKICGCTALDDLKGHLLFLIHFKLSDERWS